MGVGGSNFAASGVEERTVQYHLEFVGWRDIYPPCSVQGGMQVFVLYWERAGCTTQTWNTGSRVPALDRGNVIHCGEVIEPTVNGA